MEGESEFLLDFLGQAVLVGVMQLDVERLQPAQDRESDAACGDGTDIHAFEIVSVLDAIGDVPAAFHHPLVRGDVIANEGEDHHHHMLGDADGVRVGYLGYGDAALDGSVEIDVVGADARRDGKLQVLRFGNALRGEVGGPEWLRDHNVGVDKLLVEGRVGAFLVRGDDERMTGVLQELAQAELAGHAAQELAGIEVDRARGRRGLSARIFLDLRDVVAGIFRRIAAHGIGVENCYNFHIGSSLA
jgi:hypothetical protein